MIKFLKDNMIFVTSSILLIGLISVVSGTEKLPSLNQTEPTATPSANPSYTNIQTPSFAPRPPLNIEREREDD